MSWKGKFSPKSPQKYEGDVTQIFYRSRIELRYMQYLDQHPDIVAWASEELAIPYIKPTTMRTHKYWPDLIIRKRGPDGKMRTIMIELKHSSDLKEPVLKEGQRRTRRFLNEVVEYQVNRAKWAAAEAYCLDRGWQFMVLTEKELGKTY